MSYRNTGNLTQRTGYPSRQGRHSHLDVPMADEYSPYASDADDSKGGAGGGKKKGKGKSKDNAFVRFVKGASFYTKATYVWLVVSLLMCYGGYRSIRNNHGSVWLDCTARGCDLSISPPKRGKRTKVTFDRNQIVRTELVKVTETGEVRNSETVTTTRDTWGGTGRKTPGQKYSGGTSYNADLGPDENGLYESYVLVLKEQERRLSPNEGDGGASSLDPDSKTSQSATHNLSPLFAVVEPNESGEYIVDMRMYNRGQTRRRAQSMATRINSYTRNRRHKLVIRENRNVPWQGVVLVVVGILSAVLSLLLGQFWEPEEEPKPAIRQPVRGGRPAGGNSSSSAARRRQQAPTGYGNYGGYRPQGRGGGGGGSSSRQAYGGYRPQQQGRR